MRVGNIVGEPEAPAVAPSAEELMATLAAEAAGDLA
jgi:hypothetical protein